MKNINRTKMWEKYDKGTEHRLFIPYSRNLWKNIGWFFRSFKYAMQRVKRGYSDYDLWDIGDYITGMSAQALEDFIAFNNGYPCSYMKYNKSEDSDEGAEVWNTEIKQCSGKLFCSLESLESFNYQTPEVPGKYITEKTESGIKIHNTATDEEMKEWAARMNDIRKDRETVRREAFLWLADHSEELWT